MLKQDVLTAGLLSDLGEHTHLSETSEENLKRLVQIFVYGMYVIMYVLSNLLLLTVRKYALKYILQLLYEQPSTGIYNASRKIENSCQISEKSLQNEVVCAGSFKIGSPNEKVL